ncbi:MAG TPA: LPS export ABC transporter permease LptF [Geobacteraceae bacterium]|nr:LPS export ABC transporter permease LptF [Geobacteraceae bacterium]
MKKTISLYICREIAVPFLLGMATFTSVLLMGRFLQLAEMVVARGVLFSDIIRMVIYLLPFFSMVTIPMSFLLALLLAFGRLSADSEITAMKSSGIGLYSVLPPVLSCALLAYLATTFVSVYALPWGNTSFKKLLLNIVETRATLNLKERVFNDDFPGLVIYIDRYDKEMSSMSGILIEDERNPKEPSTIFAEQGVIEREPGTKTLRLSLKNGGIHRSLDSSGYRLLEFKDYELTINLAQTAKEATKNELDMTFAELNETLRTHTADDKERRDTLIEFHRRFSLPFACLVFALVGVPLGIQNQRSGKAAGFSVSIGVILAYYVVFSAGKTLGQKGLVPPAIAIWAPDVVFLLFGAYLFRKTALEQRILLLDLARELIATARGMAYRKRSGP